MAALSLGEIAELVAARKLPPVEGWAPQRSGDSEMRIAADGRWYHRGGEIARAAMVRAFSTLLLRDETGQHWLISPFEKLRIAVDDAAFIATDLRIDDGALAFRLNTDEFAIAGPQHPIRAAGDADTPALYVGVRRGCEARLNRSTYEQLVRHALDLGADPLAVTSGGARFSLVPAA
ncbi:DUF1285 domain-containing protein [Novosphingobium sp. Gsoil 351]|nr:DUF1285 domain-containing protein [Novosphingobium sp. Gsoil 351]